MTKSGLWWLAAAAIATAGCATSKQEEEGPRVSEQTLQKYFGGYYGEWSTFNSGYHEDLRHRMAQRAENLEHTLSEGLGVSVSLDLSFEGTHSASRGNPSSVLVEVDGAGFSPLMFIPWEQEGIDLVHEVKQMYEAGKETGFNYILDERGHRSVTDRLYRFGLEVESDWQTPAQENIYIQALLPGSERISLANRTTNICFPSPEKVDAEFSKFLHGALRYPLKIDYEMVGGELVYCFSDSNPDNPVIGENKYIFKGIGNSLLFDKSSGEFSLLGGWQGNEWDGPYQGEPEIVRVSGDKSNLLIRNGNGAMKEINFYPEGEFNSYHPRSYRVTEHNQN